MRTASKNTAFGEHWRPKLVDLDDLDARIIEMLTEDGRVTSRAIASEIGLTEATVAARIRSLHADHVVGVTGVFDWVAAGYEWDLWLFVEVQGRPVMDVANDLAGRPEVHAVTVVFGSADLVVHALLPDRQAVAVFLSRGLTSVRGVHRVVADVALDTVKYTVNFARLPVEASLPLLPAPRIPLDDLDESIIKAVLTDGRQSNREIARQLGVSDGTVRVRLKRMHEADLMRISGQLDPYLTGTIGAWAFIGLQVSGSSSRRVIEQLAAMPEVLILSQVTGQHALLMLVVGSHRSALEDIILRRIRGLPGVRAAETVEIVRTVKFDFRFARFK
jgi:DNA-binding Lrp family transcriptional regulator